MDEYKKIYDSVHGFIRLSLLEKDLIDSYAFQRLHYIHQLGVSYLIYPGATHTRFEHSLGVMEVASKIFDTITRYSSCITSEEDLSYWRQVVRFAALCHDLGHLPFSHVAEKKILRGVGHETWTLALIQSSFLSPIWDRLSQDFPGKKGVEDVIKTSIGQSKLRSMGSTWENIEFSPWDTVMSQIITGDFFGADRIDYLLRDAKSTGVSYGLFDYHQLIEMLRILPMEEGDGWTLGLEENGLESCEALLLARHFMHRRVYQHPSVQAYSFHMARFMDVLYKKDKPLLSIEKYLSYTDNEVLAEVRRAFIDPQHPGHEDAQPLCTREDRYIAVELPEAMKVDCIVDWQEESKIESKDMEFFIGEETVSPYASFAVLQGKKVVYMKGFQDASRLPKPGKNWLYLSPKYEEWIEPLLAKVR